MIADTNLQNSNICYDVNGGVDDQLEHFLRQNSDEIIFEDYDDYTLELNSNKNVCLLTVRSLERYRLLARVKRLRLLDEKFLLVNHMVQKAKFPNVVKILNLISALEFEDAIIEVSTFHSLIFKLKFDNDVFLIINIPQENLADDNPTAVFSLIEKRKTIIDNYNTIGNIVIGMENFLDQ